MEESGAILDPGSRSARDKAMYFFLHREQGTGCVTDFEVVVVVERKKDKGELRRGARVEDPARKSITKGAIGEAIRQMC